MSVKVGTDTKLLHMLGITQKNVVKADIRLRHDEIATVTLTCAADLDDTQLTTAQFTLWALDPQPRPAPAPSLDLDAMCSAAQARLARALDRSADRTLAEWRIESDDIHVRMNRALRQHSHATQKALLRANLQETLRNLTRDTIKAIDALGASSLFTAGAIGGLSSALNAGGSQASVLGSGLPGAWANAFQGASSPQTTTKANAAGLLAAAKTNIEEVDDILRSDFLRMNTAKSPAARANP